MKVFLFCLIYIILKCEAYEEEKLGWTSFEKYYYDPPTEGNATALFIYFTDFDGKGENGEPHVSSSVRKVFYEDLGHVAGVFPEATCRPHRNPYYSPEIASWFLFYGLPHMINGYEDLGQVIEARDEACDFIRILTERTGVPPNRMVIGGSSQGGSMALLTLTCPEVTFAGAIVYSTYLPNHEKFNDVIFTGPQNLNGDAPIYWAHGALDFTVPFSDAVTYTNLMRTFYRNVQLKKYLLSGHSMRRMPLILDKINSHGKKFLGKYLPPL